MVILWIDWAGLPTGSRIAFSGLAILAGVMVARLYRAHRLCSNHVAG